MKKIVVHGAPPSTDPPPPEIHPDFIDRLQLRSFTLRTKKEDPSSKESSPPSAS